MLDVGDIGKAHQIAKGVAQTRRQKGRRPEKQKRRKPAKETGVGQLDQGNNGRLYRRLACPSFLYKRFISVVQVSYVPSVKNKEDRKSRLEIRRTLDRTFGKKKVLTNAKDKREAKDHGFRRGTRRGCNGNHAGSENVLFGDRTLIAKANKTNMTNYLGTPLSD